MQPRRHINAGGHHGRGMDERAYRRRTRHRVRQPNEERNLCRLAGGADEEQQSDQRDHVRIQQLHVLLQLREIKGPDPLLAELGNEKQDAQYEAEITDAVDDERFIAGDGVGVIVIPKADEQIRTEADSLPADEEQQQIVRHHQEKHEKDKEIEIDEKSHHSFVVSHVAQGIDVNQKTDAGNDEKHYRRESVDLKRDLYLKRPGFDPGVNRVPNDAAGRQ